MRPDHKKCLFADFPTTLIPVRMWPRRQTLAGLKSWRRSALEARGPPEDKVCETATTTMEEPKKQIKNFFCQNFAVTLTNVSDIRIVFKTVFVQHLQTSTGSFQVIILIVPQLPIEHVSFGSN